MDDETKIEILGNNPTNTTIKQIVGDVQEPQGQRDLIIKIEKYEFSVAMRLFIDYLEPLIDYTTYLKINGLIYKVLKIKTHSDYMEIDLYLLRKQV